MRTLVLFALCFPTPLVAVATPPPPTLVKGQYVYTVPSDYRPDGLSDFQVKQLNGELANLHFPFRLPCRLVIGDDTCETKVEIEVGRDKT